MVQRPAELVSRQRVARLVLRLQQLVGRPVLGLQHCNQHWKVDALRTGTKKRRAEKVSYYQF